jgi:hypothetical protein
VIQLERRDIFVIEPQTLMLLPATDIDGTQLAVLDQSANLLGMDGQFICGFLRCLEFTHSRHSPAQDRFGPIRLLAS